MTGLPTRGRCGALVGLMVAAGALAAGTAGAQPNTGALTLGGALDVPSSYVFRGLIQESDPQISLTPSAELAVRLGEAVVTLGTWHALLSGSSGLDGPTARLHYEERFSAGMVLPIGGDVTAGATWTAYTSPNGLFETRQELAIRVARRGWLNPSGLAAFELAGAADGVDEGVGSYLELGIAPELRVGAIKGTITIPATVGLSLQHYYQGFAGDRRFGFLDVGVHLAWPIGAAGDFGVWQLHGGADVYLLGDTPRQRHAGERTTVVGMVGLRFRY